MCVVQCRTWHDLQVWLNQPLVSDCLLCPQWQYRCSIQYMCVARCKKKHFKFDRNHQQNSNYEIPSKPHDWVCEWDSMRNTDRTEDVLSCCPHGDGMTCQTDIQIQWHHYNNNNNNKIAELSHSWDVLMELPEAVCSAAVYFQPLASDPQHLPGLPVVVWPWLGHRVFSSCTLFPYLLKDVPSSSWTSHCPACRGLVQHLLWRTANPSASSSRYSVTHNHADTTASSLQWPYPQSEKTTCGSTFWT